MAMKVSAKITTGLSRLHLKSTFCAISMTVALTSTSFGQTPKTEREWFRLGFRQREEFKFAESIVSFNECLKLNPKSSPCLCMRAQSNWNLSNYDLVKPDLDAAIQFSPNSYLIYQIRGEYLYSGRSRKGQIDAALADFSKAIQLKPDHAPAYLGRGECYEFKKEIHLAIRDVNKALELNKNYPDAKRVLARIKAQNPSEFANAPAPNPPIHQPKPTPLPAEKISENEKATLATKHLNSAIYNFRGDKFENAVADFTKYLNFYPNSAEGFYLRGSTYKKWGKSALAVKDFEQALKIKPDFEKAKAEIGILKQTKTEEIVTSISQITDVKPTDEFYEDLQSLIERYGISKLTIGKKFNPNQHLTMIEYAGFLNQGKEYLKNAASGFGIKEIDEEKLFNSKCTLPYLSMIPEKEIAKSLICNYRIKNFPMSSGENWITRGKFAIYFNKAIAQASSEYFLKSQAENATSDLLSPKATSTQ